MIEIVYNSLKINRIDMFLTKKSGKAETEIMNLKRTWKL